MFCIQNRTMKTFYTPLLAISCSLLFSSCSNTQRLDPSVEHETAYATTDWFYSNYGMINDREVSTLAHRLLTRLSSAIPSVVATDSYLFGSSDRYLNYPWQLYILNSKELNAFSAGAGVIFITGGLIEAAQTEAELAAIISHEMAHQVLGHTTEAISQTSDENSAPYYSFTLEQELQADQMSLDIMRAARYDIRHALTALSIGYRPAEREVAEIPDNWLDTRISMLKQRIDSSMGYLPATENSREYMRVKQILKESAAS
jgi:hypothetical protein